MEQESSNSSKWLWITLIVVVLVAVGYFGWSYWNQKQTQINPAVANTVATPTPIKNNVSSTTTPTVPVTTPAATTPTTTPIKTSTPTVKTTTYTQKLGVDNQSLTVSFKVVDKYGANPTLSHGQVNGIQLSNAGMEEITIGQETNYTDMLEYYQKNKDAYGVASNTTPKTFTTSNGLKAIQWTGTQLIDLANNGLKSYSVIEQTFLQDPTNGNNSIRIIMMTNSANSTNPSIPTANSYAQSAYNTVVDSLTFK